MKQVLLAAGIIMQSFLLNGQVTMQKQDDGILITENGNSILFYQMSPKSLNGEYERNNYIHPLWGLNGQMLTEDFPSDHLHHRGIFWAWHQVVINGERIGDPWEIKDFEQQVTEVEFMSRSNGVGILKTEVEWLSDKFIKNGSKKPYLKENTILKVYPENMNYRRIDFEIRLTALVDHLQLGGSEDEKGYSGFSLRLVLPDDVMFRGPEGPVQPEVTSVESAGFVDISGSSGNNQQKGGVIIIDHPDNPGYPQQWILRNRNSMQNAAWPGNRLADIPEDEPLVLHYSLIIYSGEMKLKKISRLVKQVIASE